MDEYILGGRVAYRVVPLYVMEKGHPAKALLDVVLRLMDDQHPYAGQLPESFTEMAAKARLVSGNVQPSVSLSADGFDELHITCEFRMINTAGWRVARRTDSL